MKIIKSNIDIKELIENETGLKFNRDNKICCPFHNEKTPSFSIKNNRFKCFGCGASGDAVDFIREYKGIDFIEACKYLGIELDDILNSVGLTKADLYDNTLVKKDKVAFETQKDFENYLMTIEFNNKKVVKYYKYTDATGKLLYYKIRLENSNKNKEFMFVRYFSKDKMLVWGLSGGYKYETFKGSNQYSNKEKTGAKVIEVKEQQKELYNLVELKKAIKLGNTVFIVEGEKDVDTLTTLGIPATTSPVGGGNGKEKWLDRYSEVFKGADVVIIADNDQAGKDFSKLVKYSLKNYCYKVRTLIISDTNKGDVTDWYESLEDKQQAFTLLMDKIKDIKPDCPFWYDVKEEYEGKGEAQRKVYKIKLNKHLLAVHLKDKLNVIYVSDNKINEPLPHLYVNGVYEAVRNIKGNIQEYLYPNMISTGTISEIEKLLQNECFNDVITPAEMVGSEEIINVGNGLLDTRNMELKEHTPEYKTMYQLKCNYNKKAFNGGLWDNYINHLSNNDEEVKRVLQEFAGIVLSNYNGYRLKGGFALYGKPNSGKTVYLEALSGVIGEVASGVLGLQELNERFATNVLYGKRLVYDGDMSGEGFASVDIFKKITGGDKVTVEFKGKDRMTYKYTGLYAFACNELPMLVAEKGEAVHNRINIIRCDNVVKNKIVGLVDQIIKKESDYIFLWALEGLKRLRGNNWTLSPCRNMEQVKQEYKALSDSLYEFVLEEYEITGNANDRIEYKDFKEQYTEYCIEEGRTPIKKRAEYQKRIKSIKGMDFGQYKGNYYVKGIVKKVFKEIDVETPF